jgi:hypothetical protein
MKLLSVLLWATIFCQNFVINPFVATTGHNPTGIAHESNGDMIYVDSANHRLVRVTVAGVVSIFAGSGTAGSVDGTGTAAQFNTPYGITLDTNDLSFYVTELNGHRIRRVTSAGVVTTLLGNGNAADVEGTGVAASINGPRHLSFGPNGNLYVTTSSHRVVLVHVTTGALQFWAGTGTAGFADGSPSSAQFNSPEGIVSMGLGLVIVDSGNNRIRQFSQGNQQISTLAGSGTAGNADGTGAAASFNNPGTLFRLSSGASFVLDRGNLRVRRVSMSGEVTTGATIESGATAIAFDGHNRGIIAYSTGTLVRYDLNCPGGSILLTGQCTQCSTLNDRTVSTGGRSISCTLCSGTDRPNGARTACLRSCAAGQYSLNAVCTNCAAGTFSAAGNVESCTGCAAGTFSASGASSCTSCAAGTFSLSNASTCSSCPANTNSAAGSSRCSPVCSAGSFVNSNNQCQTCAVNTFSAGGIVTSCTACESGRTAAEGSAVCTEAANSSQTVVIAASTSSVGVVLIAGGVFFFLHRRAKRRAAAQGTILPDTPTA